MVEAFGSALGGGVLIGVSASLLWIAMGKRAGISGIVAGLLPGGETRIASGSGLTWNAWFIAGLLAGGLALRFVRPEALGASPRSLPWLIGAGLLVGAGSRLSSGCTSGHGVCGLARGAKRSLVATLVFMLTGMFAVFALRRFFGDGA